MNVPIRGWTFTHWWVRPVVNVWFNIYHKSVTYSGIDHVNWQQPIIFAPSHRNAFSDALCLVLPAKYTNNRFLYPLIRADAFGQSSLLDWILTRFHMFPVYRPRDRVKLKQKNEDVFDQCYQLLAQNRNLLIHPEGNCIPQKHVRSFKKGLARIAFGAEEKCDFNLGVTIIPVGINYRDITAPRRGIHVRYGAPISVNDFKKTYQSNAARGIKKLTHAVQEGVKKVAIDIPSGPFYSLYNDLLTLNKSSNLALTGQPEYNLDELRSNQRLVDSLKKMGNDTKHAMKEKARKLDDLKKELNQQHLKLNQPLERSFSLIHLCAWAMCGLVLSPLILYGMINNIIPWTAMHTLTAQVKEKQFKSSARMTLGLVLFPLCYVLQALVVLLLSGRWLWALLYLLSLPFTGLVALKAKENMHLWCQELRLRQLSTSTKEQINEMIEHLFSGVSR